MMFTGQHLLQQLAQQQGLRLPEGQPPLLEGQPLPAVKPEQTPEQQYQDVFHRQVLLLVHIISYFRDRHTFT